MPDIDLVMCNIGGNMDPVPSEKVSEEEFKMPALPCVGPSVQKQRRTMEWLQIVVEDVHQFDSEAVSQYSGRRLHMSESVEVDFKELHKRSQSTSTPFIPRTSAMTSLHSDSGIDTFSFSLQSSTMTTSSCYNSANDSLFSQSADFPGHVVPVDSEHKYISSKCSETDSAFGDGSSHDISQDSQLSECFSLDLPSELSNIETSHNALRKACEKVESNSVKRSHQETAQITPSNSTKPSSSPSLVDSCANLSLPAPSWCSPLPTPSAITKPSCTSTPKDSIQENLKLMLKQFSPGEPDRLIGRKMGLDNVDIVSELHSRSICSLRLVFQHLDAKDLCRSCIVSRHWRSAIHSDSASLKRKKLFLKSQKLPCQKENAGFKGAKAKPERAMTAGSTRLGSIQAVAEKPIPPTKETVLLHVPKHRQFWEEANKCKEGESIRKCPQCMSPARVHNVQERAWCSNEQCNYDFCIRCNLPFHGAKDCLLSTPTKNAKKVKSENVIGSKKSKRKLRRL